MSILGYRAKHFPESDQEIADNDFSCGNPIVAEYHTLDRKYPDSIFITMQRDDASWLRSIRAHMNRKPVDTLRPSRRDRRLRLYGTVSPTDSELLANKHDHEADVHRYFYERPADILYINIVDGQGWEQLRPFLNRPVLVQPFPKRNVTSDLRGFRDVDPADKATHA